MTKIIMLKTRRGAEDGFAVPQFKKGEIYDVRDSLACYFLASNYAELADVKYYNILWKGNKRTRQPMSDLLQEYINRGVASIEE